MRIAFFISEFPSLSQTFVLNQITGLIERGHTVEIFAQKADNSLKIHNDVIKYDLLKYTQYFPTVHKNRVLRFVQAIKAIGIHLPQNPTAILNALNVRKHGMASISLVLLFQALPFLKKNEFDIIYCHFGPNGNIAVKLREANVISGKVVTVFHGFDLTSYLAKRDKQLYDTLFEKGDLFLPISKRWQKKLVDMGCSSQKISVHRMGIDVANIPFSIPNLSGKDKVKILSVARLVEKKGIEYGIQAISTLVQSHPNLEYIIVGDGPLRDELDQLIDRLGMSQHIKIMGWMNQEETFSFMRMSDIFLAPSVTSQSGDQEGIPVVLMEAMAHGLPVVSTRHSGIPELISDGQTGYLADERDAQGLANKIDMLISNSELMKKFGNEGRRVVEKDYNTKRLNDSLADTFNKLVQI